MTKYSAHLLTQLQEGNQAIHIAAAAGHLHIVKALVEEYNVPPNAINNVSSVMMCMCKVILCNAALHLLHLFDQQYIYD